MKAQRTPKARAATTMLLPTTRERKPLDRIYDVFLSHRFADCALVEELYAYIEDELHYNAYVDWKDSAEDLSREHVSKDTADYLREVMRHASSLIFVVGPDSAGSRWMPWELGFFDGRQSARRIAIYLPEGVDLPKGQEYLGVYSTLRRAQVADFLAAATLDVAAMDSATSDQWLRHLTRAVTRPDDYWLSLVQWQLGFAANVMTRGGQSNLMPDEQPRDEPREPTALFGPWLGALRQGQQTIAAARKRLNEFHRQQGAAFPELDPQNWPATFALLARRLGGGNVPYTGGKPEAGLKAAPFPDAETLPGWLDMGKSWGQAVNTALGAAAAWQQEQRDAQRRVNTRALKTGGSGFS